MLEPRYEPLNLARARVLFRNSACVLTLLTCGIVVAQRLSRNSLVQSLAIFPLMTLAFLVPVFAFLTIATNSLERRPAFPAMIVPLAAVVLNLVAFSIGGRLWGEFFWATRPQSRYTRTSSCLRVLVVKFHHEVTKAQKGRTERIPQPEPPTRDVRFVADLQGRIVGGIAEGK